MFKTGQESTRSPKYHPKTDQDDPRAALERLQLTQQPIGIRLVPLSEHGDVRWRQALAEAAREREPAVEDEEHLLGKVPAGRLEGQEVEALDSPPRALTLHASHARARTS